MVVAELGSELSSLALLFSVLFLRPNRPKCKTNQIGTPPKRGVGGT